MEAVDPDFYRIGYARMMRAYGVEFLEGADGMGVYASRDVEPLRRARVRELPTFPSIHRASGCLSSVRLSAFCLQANRNCTQQPSIFGTRCSLEHVIVNRKIAY